MVATELNRLPSFKSRRTLSPLENEPKETEEQSREEPLEQSRDIPAGSGLDIETKNFSATARGRSFFVDIPFYRTTYLRMRRISELLVRSGFPNAYSNQTGLTSERSFRSTSNHEFNPPMLGANTRRKELYNSVFPLRVE